MINRRDILKLPACLALPNLPAISGTIEPRPEHWVMQLEPWTFFRHGERCNVWFCGEKLTFDVGSNAETCLLVFNSELGHGQAELGFRDGRLLIRRLWHDLEHSQFPKQIYYNDLLV